MLGRLLAIFLITPVVELALLLQLGDAIGILPTIGIIVATGVTGSFLAKREGLSVWRQFNQRLQGGELPGTELIDGVIILTAGALLITPGVLTDVGGFLGLIPFTRRHMRRYISTRIQRAADRGSGVWMFGGFQSRRTEDPLAGGRTPDVHGPDELWRGRQKDTPRYGDE
jgi:UPF0716 protein FxsA